MNVSSSFLQFQGTSECFPQYVSQNGEVPNVLKQFLVEMNINIAAAEATELEHKKTFDELSDTKIEEIAASNQQASRSRRRNSRTIVTQAETLLEGSRGAWTRQMWGRNTWRVTTNCVAIAHWDCENGKFPMRAPETWVRSQTVSPWRGLEFSSGRCTPKFWRSATFHRGILKMMSAALMLSWEIVSSLQSIPKGKCFASIDEDMQPISRDTELLRLRLETTHRGLDFVRNLRILSAELRVKHELSRERSVSWRSCKEVQASHWNWVSARGSSCA